ncbi:uncharacterized protein LOC135820283 [Sycon ciliatum]|uniref:uncharacterized protein LOC135820283 n=1 Tax=Sycon ciliatum TaxID=27933 RepID=UPI0020AEC0DA|eukprot:scpid79531/ scgid31583/ Probable serine/threonine-protein kinase At1g18390
MVSAFSSDINYRSISNDQYAYRVSNTILGHGAFGAAWLGKRLHDNLAVVAKIPYARGADYETEVNAMALLFDAGGHQNIVSLVDFIVNADVPEEGHKMLITLEKMDMNLEHWLGLRGRGSGLPEAVKLEISVQLYSGLAFIVNHGIIHEDLHEGNILVDVNNGVFKISDFGNSTVIPKDDNSFDQMLANVVDHAIKDLRDMTSSIIAYLWLSRFYAEGGFKFSTWSEMPDNEHVEEALSLVFSDPVDEDDGPMAVKLKENPHFWESQTESDVMLKVEIIRAHRENCSQPNPSHSGMAIPDHIADILAVGLLYTRLGDATATNMVQLIRQIHSPQNCLKARNFIRGAGD